LHRAQEKDMDKPEFGKWATGPGRGGCDWSNQVDKDSNKAKCHCCGETTKVPSGGPVRRLYADTHQKSKCRTRKEKSTGQGMLLDADTDQ